MPNVFNKLALLEKDQRKSPTQIKQDQFSALKKLLIHAFENCDYYRDKFNSCGINPYQVMSWRDFYKVPILKKKDVQKNLDAILAKGVNKNELFEDATGGSIGEPLIFYHDRQCKEWFESCDIFAKKWWGIRPWCKKAFLWGADRDIPELSLKERLKLKLERSTFLNSFDMDDTKMEAYSRFLIKWRPGYLQGYASSLHLFSTYLLKNNITVPKPKAIRSSADTLTPEKRTVIEQVFGDKIYDFYGSREITNIAVECPAHQGLHIFSTIRYVEILNSDGEQLVDKPGKIIVTDLVNYSMPFIRYEIGDVGIISDKECECGRPFP
ncbi:MAG: phenylacetate--CoA ligase family protein, partial [Candidatus Heimdallarchaeota archaeon]